MFKKWFFIDLKPIWEGQNFQISLRGFKLKNFLDLNLKPIWDNK